jgi:glucosamine--fructose-6-phosphate aminotransferase (isomerizing)
VSTLAREAADAPASAARQIGAGDEAITELVRRLRATPPSVVVTCARGSSDHAATFGKYLLETTVGCPVASVGPGVASMYGRSLRLEGALFIAVSQSGASPDLVQMSAAARASGAFVVGIINDVSSRLAAECDLVIPQCAGDERAVAATKSFLMSCLAFLRIAAAWTDAPALHAAVSRTPDALSSASALDWAAPLLPLATARNLYVVGRGIGLSAALEIALKLKETCRLHAEAFSTAELRHGPIALLEDGFPIIALGQHDETYTSVREAIIELERLTHEVASSLPVEHTRRLPTVPDIPAVLSPLCQVLSCYLALPALAIARGLDPDVPPHLAKVTRTT